MSYNPTYIFMVNVYYLLCYLRFCIGLLIFFLFFFSSRRRHTRCLSDWSSDVCSSDLSSVDDWLNADFIKSALSQSSTEEPILLIGDESTSVNPLVKLLGRSLSAQDRKSVV